MGIFILLLIPTLIIVCYLAETRRLKHEGIAWYEVQNKKPKYKIKVTTNSGRSLESEVFEPYYRAVGPILGSYSETSLKQAESIIKDSIRQNYYENAFTSEFIPMCEIKSLTIVEDLPPQTVNDIRESKGLTREPGLDFVMVTK